MNTEKTLHQIIVTGLYLLLLMPLVYVSTTIFPFVVGKFVYFQIMVELIAVCYIILAAMNKDYRPKRSLIFWLMLAHFGAWFLSGIFSISPMRSFFGNFERMSGIFNYAHFVAYFIILASVMRSKKQWIAYLVTAIFISTIQAIIAIVQYYSSKPVLFAQPHGRVWGTLGNYIYLAAYTMTHAFLALFVLPMIKRKEMRFWIWAMMAFNIFAFFLAQTRGAYMGMAAGAFVALGYIGWINRAKKSVRNITIGIFAIILVLAIWTKTNNTTVYKVPVLRTFKHITLNEGRTRLTAWQIAWEGFLKRPMFGWGADNFYFVYNQLYKPKILLNSYYETWFDRSHNIFMDEMATTGAVGALTYLGLAAALFLGVHELRKKYQLNTTSIAALYGLLTSYYVSNFFVFDNAASFLLFALIAALIASFGFEHAEQPGTESQKTMPKSLAVILLAGVMMSIYLYSVRPFILANELLMAESTAQQSGFANALPMYKKAFERGGPLSDEIIAGLMRVAAEKTNGQNSIIKTNPKEVEEAYNLSLELQKSRPKDVYTWITLGQLATNLGAANPQYFDEAEKFFAKALEFSPRRQQVYYSWVKAKVMRQDFEGAFALLEKVEQLEPLVPDTYWYRGLINADLGKDEEAVKWMLKAYHNSPTHRYQWKSVNEPITLAQLLEKTGKFEEIPLFLNEALNQAPDNQDILLALAQNYARVGDMENARKTILRLLDINPKHQGALNFLQGFLPKR